MKRLITLLIPALMLGITACGDDEPQPQLPQQLPTEQGGNGTDDNNENKNEPMDISVLGSGDVTVTLSINQ